MSEAGSYEAASNLIIKRESTETLSGNDVYHTNSLILLVKKMLCSKLYCQKGFNSTLFSYKIEGSLVGGLHSRVANLWSRLAGWRTGCTTD